MTLTQSALLSGLILLGLTGACRAETATDSGGSPAAALAASARLDFVIDIGKFIFFRVGTGAYPTASGTVDTVTFGLAIPPVPTSPPASSNDVVVPWDGNQPVFVGSGNVLTAEIRSNAGQVTIQSTVISPLVSGPNSIPLSEISVTSSDANFPAPTIPNAGTGAAINVTGTAFSNLVTIRTATWTFAFNPVTVPPPGSYSGQVSFTAAAP